MEFEDKNLKAAVKKAAKYLKVPEETIRYEVISYGSTGIFGLVGAKKAKIRVSTSNNGKDEQTVKTDRSDPMPKQRAKKKPPTKKPVSKKPALKKPALKKPEDPPQKAESKEVEASVEEVDAVKKGCDVIQKIVDKITDGATVKTEKKDDGVVYHVEGGKTALIIGKRGQTLEAIQYLVDRVINKKTEKRIRFQVDVAGYLENKKANLEQRALHLCEKVKKTGKPVTVGELNVYDRKIVHMCLKENRDVRTQSMGSGFYRKLMIFPKRANGPKKESQQE